MVEELETGIDDLAETLCTSKTLGLLDHSASMKLSMSTASNLVLMLLIIAFCTNLLSYLSLSPFQLVRNWECNWIEIQK